MKMYRLVLLGMVVSGCTVSVAPLQPAPISAPAGLDATGAVTDIAAPALIAASSRPAYAKDSGQGGKFSIYGKIAGDGKPVTVTLTKDEPGARAVTLDSVEGEFEFLALAGGTYGVSLAAKQSKGVTIDPNPKNVTLDAANPRAALSFQELLRDCMIPGGNGSAPQAPVCTYTPVTPAPLRAASIRP